MVVSHITIFDVLEYYGVELVGHTTQQVRCPVHADRSPSARAYGDGNKIYCFKCAKLWDVISLVQAKEHLPYEQALALLESRFTVPSASENLTGIIKMQLKRHAPLNLDVRFRNVEAELIACRKTIAIDRYNRAFIAFDILQHQLKTRVTDPEDAQEQAKAILQYAKR